MKPRPSTVFAPVRSQTAFEETLERLGTAIKLGLLEPGARLPAERELCRQLGISRSTLRQALTALVQSGHLRATRGRSGGTLRGRVAAARADAQRRRCSAAGATPATSGSPSSSPSRCSPRSGRSRRALAPLDELVAAMDATLEDFPAFRQADVRWHIGLAEAAGRPRLVAAMTEAQGHMSDLISYIAHPPELLAWTNQQHAHLLLAAAGRRRRRARCGSWPSTSGHGARLGRRLPARAVHVKLLDRGLGA